jgi:hypothetical protein
MTHPHQQYMGIQPIHIWNHHLALSRCPPKTHWVSWFLGDRDIDGLSRNLMDFWRIFDGFWMVLVYQSLFWAVHPAATSLLQRAQAAFQFQWARAEPWIGSLVQLLYLLLEGNNWPKKNGAGGPTPPQSIKKCRESPHGTPRNICNSRELCVVLIRQGDLMRSASVDLNSRVGMGKPRETQRFVSCMGWYLLCVCHVCWFWGVLQVRHDTYK